MFDEKDKEYWSKKYPLCFKALSEMDQAEKTACIIQNDERVAEIKKDNEEWEKENPKKLGVPFVISDDLGVQGLHCHADGKKYDSKSQYYKAVKKAGYEVVGNEKLGPSKPKVKDIDWSTAVHETMQKLGA